MTASRGINKAYAIWTKQMVDEVVRRYPNERTETIAESIGLRLQQVYHKAKRLGLKKTAEYLASADACRLRRGGDVGKDTRFKKGQTSHNKGKKGISYPGMQATQFKKGERRGVAAKLYKPIGTLRISKDGYLERKVNDDMPPQKRWKAVHRIVWEQSNGAIPSGYIIVFKDGAKTIDPSEITIDKLEMISFAENMSRNSYHNNFPKEVGQLIQLRGQIQRQINKRAKP